MAIRAPAHKLPVPVPHTLTDNAVRRFIDGVRSAAKGIQDYPARARIVVRYAGDTAGLFEEVVAYADRAMRLVGAWWTQSSSLGASATDYWTMELRAGRPGKSLSTDAIARLTTKSEGFDSGALRDFGRVVTPVIPAGHVLTFNITETGTAAGWGPGSLVLLLEEVAGAA